MPPALATTSFKCNGWKSSIPRTHSRSPITSYELRKRAQALGVNCQEVNTEHAATATPKCSRWLIADQKFLFFLMNWSAASTYAEHQTDICPAHTKFGAKEVYHSVIGHDCDSSTRRDCEKYGMTPIKRESLNQLHSAHASCRFKGLKIRFVDDAAWTMTYLFLVHIPSRDCGTTKYFLWLNPRLIRTIATDRPSDSNHNKHKMTVERALLCSASINSKDSGRRNSLCFLCGILCLTWLYILYYTFSVHRRLLEESKSKSPQTPDR